MGYVIKLKLRESGAPPMYLAAPPTDIDQNDHQVYGLQRKDFALEDLANAPFESFEEASKFPYPTAEIAANVVFTLPKTKNIDYEVVEVKGR